MPDQRGRIESVRRRIVTLGECPEQTRTLNLAGAGLTELPEEIDQLEYLETLDLRSNYLTFLPPQIGRLAELRNLLVDVNSLQALPEEITNLRKLRRLSVSHNKIRELPPALQNLTDLDHLDVTYNQLKSLPRYLAELDALSRGGLRLAHNPFDEPIPSLLRMGTSSLASYLRSLDSGGTAQYECKLLLVGEGEVGKTSLLAALRDEPFVDGRLTTHGIEIRRFSVDHPSDADVRIDLNAWDFGGQEVYRITHQFFFSKRCLYLVVWNPRQGQEANEVEEWVRRIQLRVGSDASILIVATHSAIRFPELDYERLLHSYPEVLVGQIAIDSLTREGLPELKLMLSEQAAQLPQMGELLNDRWVMARDELLHIGKPHISLREYRQICERHDVTDMESDVLSGLLHDLGHIVHYLEDDGLRDIVVLQPEWLTKAIGYVLEDRATRASSGVLQHDRLSQIWASVQSSYGPELYPYFLRLMEKFDVSYRLPDGDSSLIGQLVPYERPVLPWVAGAVLDHDQRVLRLRCRLEGEAPGLIAWLTVRNSRFSIDLHWRRGVLFAHDAYQSTAVLEMTSGATLVLEVRAPSPDYFFSILRDSIEELIGLRWPGLAYELFVPCPNAMSSGGACEGEFAFKTLQRYRERQRALIECSVCLELHEVSLLLTGFRGAGLDLATSLEKVLGAQNQLALGIGRIEAYAADAAVQLRAVLRAIADESNESPRIFTLSVDEVGGLRRWWQMKYRLTLWCEHSGSEHAWEPATYEVPEIASWVRQLLPYASLVAKALRLFAPFGKSLAVEFIGSEADLARIQAHLDLVKDLSSMDVSDAGGMEPSLLASAGGVSLAEGASYRELLSILDICDSSRSWGGLRRVVTAAGDYNWLCPVHYREFDPGLPVLPPQRTGD